MNQDAWGSRLVRRIVGLVLRLVSGGRLAPFLGLVLLGCFVDLPGGLAILSSSLPFWNLGDRPLTGFGL